MKTKQKILSKTRLNRLHAQGYENVSDEQLSAMAFGIRFAYRMCVSILIVAIILQSIATFYMMLIISFMGIILPNHPFDYIYNNLLSKPLNKPKLPVRSKQLKFACTVATAWLAGTIYFLSTGATLSGLLMAGVLVGIAFLPSSIDLCIPSLIYNKLFQKRAVKIQPF